MEVRLEPSDDVEIVGWDARFKAAFFALNVEWIQRYFVVEPADEEILSNPEGLILAGGGEVFFVVDKRTGEVLGTSALQPHHGVWELAKMAVSPRAQGRGIGRRLALAAIEAARQRGASELLLETNSRLLPAIRLYESLGFSRTDPPADLRFERADVFMRLGL